MPNRKEIGKLIKKLRLKYGLSQVEMADGIHLSQSAYAKIENGYTGVDIERLNQIASYLNVSFIELLPNGLNEIRNSKESNVDMLKEYAVYVEKQLHEFKDQKILELEQKLKITNKLLEKHGIKKPD